MFYDADDFLVDDMFTPVGGVGSYEALFVLEADTAVYKEHIDVNIANGVRDVRVGPDGHVYCTGRTNLFKIDKDTREVTILCDIKETFPNYFPYDGNLTFDSLGNFYVQGSNPPLSPWLVKIDPNGTIVSGHQMDGGGGWSATKLLSDNRTLLYGTLLKGTVSPSNHPEQIKAYDVVSNLQLPDFYVPTNLYPHLHPDFYFFDLAIGVVPPQGGIIVACENLQEGPNNPDSSIVAVGLVGTEEKFYRTLHSETTGWQYSDSGWQIGITTNGQYIWVVSIQDSHYYKFNIVTQELVKTILVQDSAFGVPGGSVNIPSAQMTVASIVAGFPGIARVPKLGTTQDLFVRTSP